MPFAVSPLRPIETGEVTQFKVPFSQFLSTSFDQGVHDSMFSSIMDLTEQDLERSGPMISKEVADKKYGMPGLEFGPLTYESEAILLRNRKQAELTRQFYLSQGNRDGLLSKKGLSGLGVEMISSMINPLDAAVNFMPIVGSSKLATKLGSAGVGKARQALAAGLITSEVLAERIPFAPKLTESLIEGFVGNVVAEVPRAFNAMESQSQYTMEDSIVGVFAGTAVGGVLHFGLTAASKSFEKLHTVTKEAALRKAVNDFVEGRTIQVQQLVKIDENVIRDRVKFNYDVAKESALMSIDEADIKKAIQEKYHEDPIYPSWRLQDGTILKGKVGQIHAMNLELYDLMDTDPLRSENAEKGFVTNKGRFVSSEEAGNLTGKGSELYSEDLGTLEFDYMTPDEKEVYLAAKDELGTDAQAANAVRHYRRERREAAFFERPDIIQKIEEEKATRINQIIENERQSWDEESRFRKEYVTEMERQVAEGKTLAPDLLKKWSFESPEKAQTALKEQATEVEKQIKELAEELQEELPDQVKAELDLVKESKKEIDSVAKGSTAAIDVAIDCLTNLKL